MLAAFTTCEGLFSKSASFDWSAAPAVCRSRFGNGRHRPVMVSRPDGLAHAPTRSSASARKVSEGEFFEAKDTSAAAFGAAPNRKLAFIVRRRNGAFVERSSFIASRGKALVIGRSLIARAASVATNKSRSSRNKATSGLSRRRKATTAATRTADEKSDDNSRSIFGSAQPSRPITPAWRRYLSL